MVPFIFHLVMMAFVLAVVLMAGVIVHQDGSEALAAIAALLYAITALIRTINK